MGAGLWTCAVLLGLGLAAATTVYPGPGGWAAGAPSRAGYEEPPAATAFVAAHALARPLSAGRLSPLYHAEAARRGRDPDGLDPLWLEAARLVEFSYLDGMADEQGFAYALYTARPKRPGVDGPTTVWRLDLDPLGRVIWGEAVRLLEGSRVRRSALTGADASDMIPPRARARLAGLTAGAGLGVQSDTGDAYYAVGFHRGPGHPRPAVVQFVIASAHEEPVLDVWSYGRPLSVAEQADREGIARPLLADDHGLRPDAQPLLRAYLAALR